MHRTFSQNLILTLLNPRKDRRFLVSAFLIVLVLKRWGLCNMFIIRRSLFCVLFFFAFLCFILRGFILFTLSFFSFDHWRCFRAPASYFEMGKSKKSDVKVFFFSFSFLHADLIILKSIALVWSYWYVFRLPYLLLLWKYLPWRSVLVSILFF